LRNELEALSDAVQSTTAQPEPTPSGDALAPTLETTGYSHEPVEPPGLGRTFASAPALTDEISAQRRRDLEAHIQETLELLKEYEDKLRLSDDPKEKRRCEHEIAELRQLLDSYQSERTMVNQRDGASVAQVLAAHLTTPQKGHRVLELEGDLAREIVTVLKQVRDNAVEFNSLVEALRQQGITITGDGNIVGSNNQVIVVKGSGVQNVIREISRIARAREIEFVNSVLCRERINGTY